MRVRLVLEFPWRKSPTATWTKATPPPPEDPKALVGCWLCADADLAGPSRIEVDTLSTGRVVVRASWADEDTNVTWQHGDAGLIPGGLVWVSDDPVRRECTLLRHGDTMEMRMLSTLESGKAPVVSVHRYTYAMDQSTRLPVKARPVKPAASTVTTGDHHGRAESVA